MELLQHEDELHDFGDADHGNEMHWQESRDRDDADQALFTSSDDEFPRHTPDHNVEEKLCREIEDMDAFYEAAREDFSRLSPTPREEDMPMQSLAAAALMLSDDNQEDMFSCETIPDDVPVVLHPRYWPGAGDEYWADSD